MSVYMKQLSIFEQLNSHALSQGNSAVPDCMHAIIGWAFSPIKIITRVRNIGDDHEVLPGLFPCSWVTSFSWSHACAGCGCRMLSFSLIPTWNPHLGFGRAELGPK